MESSTQPLSLTILGAGVTGAGIARLAVAQGVDVVLVDPRRDALERARTRIERTAPLGGTVTPGRLLTTPRADDAQQPTAVIEAVTESTVVKTRAFAQVCKTVDPGTPLASCSSAIPVDELADWAGRPFDLIGTHFANPAFGSRVVEVARGRHTSDHAVDTALRVLTALGMSAVFVWSAPGLVGSRLQYPLINAAARFLGRGARAVTVDQAMSRCYGHAVGPLRAADLIGIDSLVHTLDEIYTRTGDESCRPCSVLLGMVETGALGRKAGRGFYQYH